VNDDSSPTPSETDSISPRTPSNREVWSVQLGFFIALMTPTLAWYAIVYASHNGWLGLLGLVVTVGVMVLFLSPKSRWAITNKVAGFIVRVLLYVAVIVLLVVAGLPIWAAIYGVAAALLIALARPNLRSTAPHPPTT